MRVLSTVLALFALVVSLIIQYQSDTSITLETWLYAAAAIVVVVVVMVIVLFIAGWIRDRMG